MTNWKTLDDFEAELLKDDAFQKAHEENEAGYIVAREILQARLELGLSQTALAERIGTSQARISKWEKAEEEPRISALRKIAEATGRVLVLGLAPQPASKGARGTRSHSSARTKKVATPRKATARKTAATSARKSTAARTVRKAAVKRSSSHQSTAKKGARKAAKRSTTGKSAARKTTRRTAGSK